MLHTALEDGPSTEPYHTEIINKIVAVVFVSYLLIIVRSRLV